MGTDLCMAWLHHYRFPVKFWLAACAVSVLSCCSWLLECTGLPQLADTLVCDSWLVGGLFPACSWLVDTLACFCSLVDAYTNLVYCWLVRIGLAAEGECTGLLQWANNTDGIFYYRRCNSLLTWYIMGSMPSCSWYQQLKSWCHSQVFSPSWSSLPTLGTYYFY